MKMERATTPVVYKYDWATITSRMSPTKLLPQVGLDAAHFIELLFFTGPIEG